MQLMKKIPLLVLTLPETSIYARSPVAYRALKSRFSALNTL